MGKPIKFRAKLPRIKIVNRCILCGRIISMGMFVCSNCNKRRKK